MPALIFGLYAGVIVDKYNRKNVMIVSDILRTLLVAIIPFSIIYVFITPLLIGIITFLLASFATFFYPARDSLIPCITTTEELPIANSAIAVSGQMSHLMGPLFAAIGIAIFGLTHLFTANSVSFIFSIIMIGMIVTPVQKNKFQKQTYPVSIFRTAQFFNFSLVGFRFSRFNSPLFFVRFSFCHLGSFLSADSAFNAEDLLPISCWNTSFSGPFPRRNFADFFPSS